MSQATFSFANHDQIRALFGAQDKNLRRVRDSVGIDVVIRGDELLLQGEDHQIQRGLEVFTELQKILEKKGCLPDFDLQQILEPDGKVESSLQGGKPTENEIDLFEKAKKIRPRSPGQAEYVTAMKEEDLVFGLGPAGCGKTYLAVAMAINALRQEQVRKIVLARPAVEAGEKLGFLPGDLLAKVNPYLRPLLDALSDIIGFPQAKQYMENDIIEIVPLAFMRGRTLNDTFIILDEAQNTTITQMKMFLTRMGTDSQIIVTGDTTQIDLPDHVSCGLTDAVKRLAHVKGVAVVNMTIHDIVRHRLVGDIVRAYESSDSRKKSRKK